MVKSIELLYNGDCDVCKENFRAYLTRVTESADNVLRKYFKTVLQRVSEEHSAAFTSSNITDLKDKL